MTNPFYREITSQEKAEAVKAVWSKIKTVKQICRELQVSKQTYYQWEKKIEEQITKAVEIQKRGRHPKDYVAPENQAQEIARLKEQNQTLQKENRKLQRSNDLRESDLRIARIIIEDVMGDGGTIKKTPLSGRGEEGITQ